MIGLFLPVLECVDDVALSSSVNKQIRELNDRTGLFLPVLECVDDVAFSSSVNKQKVS